MYEWVIFVVDISYTYFYFFLILFFHFNFIYIMFNYRCCYCRSLLLHVRLWRVRSLFRRRRASGWYLWLSREIAMLLKWRQYVDKFVGINFLFFYFLFFSLCWCFIFRFQRVLRCIFMARVLVLQFRWLSIRVWLRVRHYWEAVQVDKYEIWDRYVICW